MYWVTLIILLIAINGATQLSINDWKHKDVCPKIFGIPACYIVLLFFLGAGIAHIINTKEANTYFFLFAAIPGLIALMGTIMELSGKVICPRTKSGIPMCYISLGFCAGLLLAKYLSL